jgi:hypothetical protein
MRCMVPACLQAKKLRTLAKVDGADFQKSALRSKAGLRA